jgi:5-methylcytosine-specific restriction endonuclease McrA
MTESIIPTQVCNDCKRELPCTPEHFYRASRAKRGFQGTCKPCATRRYHERYKEKKCATEKVRRDAFSPEKKEQECQRKHQVYLKNRVRYLAASRRWREQNHERYLEVSRAWAARNRDKRRAAQKRFKERHPDRVKASWKKNPEARREASRRWRLRHPEKSRAYLRIRRERLKAAPGHHTARDLRKQFEVQKGLCWWCGKKIIGTRHTDHRLAIARGGSNDPSNIVVTCPDCNLRKGTMLPSEFCGRLL